MQQIIKITSENIGSEIEKTTEFYNRNFPKAQHEEKYKRYMYKKESHKAIILIIKSENLIIALLESWIPPKRQSVRLFTTLLVDENFRNQNLARQMIEKLFEITNNEKEVIPIVVNFRDYNKTTHIPFYEKFGFKNPIVIGKYANGDEMWEMQKQMI